MDYGKRLTLLIDAAYETQENEDGMRTHLGGSVLGRKCMREVWFSFRWCDSEPFDGRMLRLFNRGHREEQQFADLLRRVGATVFSEDAQGNQFGLSFLGGHAGGHIDGVAINLPDLPGGLPPGTPVLLEEKTHNEKSFKQLVKEGLQKSKPTHYRQAQLYMSKLDLPWCLYCAVNKNDDTLWFTLFPHDEPTSRYLHNRAETIVFGSGLPPRISDTPSWFECTFCAMKGVCFKYKLPRVNCRTCRYSKPEQDGTWSCQGNQPEIKTQPKIGCQYHAFIPELC